MARHDTALITLTTDFGLDDAYAGVMKGVILSRLPGAQVIDLTHAIAPQDVVEAAFVFQDAWRYFPTGSVHVVVVDPGVGTARRRIALVSKGHFFLGPDNGCLSGALPESARGHRQADAGYELRQVDVPDGVTMVAIENTALFNEAVSATFEGRDVFAPCAALVAAGGTIDDLGPRAHSLQALPAFRATRADKGLSGLVMHVDHYGNLISDIRAEDAAGATALQIAGRILPLVRTYGEAEGLCALAGSSGYIEVAVANGSAAAALAAGKGVPVVVQPRL